MKIESLENTNCVLMRATCSDDMYNDITIAYLELDKKNITNWKVLKEKLQELKKLGVSELCVHQRVTWIDGIPDELTEHEEMLSDEEHYEVNKATQFMKDNEMRVDSTEAIINDYGVGFKTIVKYTSMVVSTWSLSWDFIEQALKNCDPQSVRFIKEEK